MSVGDQPSNLSLSLRPSSPNPAGLPRALTPAVRLPGRGGRAHSPRRFWCPGGPTSRVRSPLVKKKPPHACEEPTCTRTHPRWRSRSRSPACSSRRFPHPGQSRCQPREWQQPGSRKEGGKEKRSGQKFLARGLPSPHSPQPHAITQPCTAITQPCTAFPSLPSPHLRVQQPHRRLVAPVPRPLEGAPGVPELEQLHALQLLSVNEAVVGKVGRRAGVREGEGGAEREGNGGERSFPTWPSQAGPPNPFSEALSQTCTRARAGGL